jgi:hypothetical protein
VNKERGRRKRRKKKERKKSNFISKTKKYPNNFLAGRGKQGQSGKLAPSYFLYNSNVKTKQPLLDFTMIIKIKDKRVFQYQTKGTVLLCIGFYYYYFFTCPHKKGKEDSN